MEGLTLKVTSEKIEEHLKTCKQCKCYYEHMNEEISLERDEVADNKEIDYLKKVRKNNRKKMILSVVGVGVLIIVGIYIKLFIIGNPTTAYGINDLTVTEGQLHISGTLYESATSYRKYKMIENAQGEQELIIYTTLSQGKHQGGDFNLTFPMDEIDSELMINGMTVKKDGKVVSKLANELYAAKHLYIGDMSANGKLAQLLGISQKLGHFTNELQTTAKPYGWTLLFEESVADSEPLNEKMKAYGAVLLAMVDNLEEVSWQYQLASDGRMQTMKLTVEEASKRVGSDIKSFVTSPEKVQELIYLLGL